MGWGHVLPLFFGSTRCTVCALMSILPHFNMTFHLPEGEKGEEANHLVRAQGLVSGEGADNHPLKKRFTIIYLHLVLFLDVLGPFGGLACKRIGAGANATITVVHINGFVGRLLVESIPFLEGGI